MAAEDQFAALRLEHVDRGDGGAEAALDQPHDVLERLVGIVRVRDELADFLERQQQRTLVGGGNDAHVRRVTISCRPPTFRSRLIHVRREPGERPIVVARHVGRATIMPRSNVKTCNQLEKADMRLQPGVYLGPSTRTPCTFRR